MQHATYDKKEWHMELIDENPQRILWGRVVEMTENDKKCSAYTGIIKE